MTFNSFTAMEKKAIARNRADKELHLNAHSFSNSKKAESFTPMTSRELTGLWSLVFRVM